MVQKTSISLGSHFENFVNSAIAEGEFNNVSEVVRAGLRLLEEERKHQAIIEALIEGEKSGTVKDFDGEAHLKDLHEKYIDENGQLRNNR